MSTQDGSGVDFTLLPEESQQHFRLLELPPDLLDLLTSNESAILQFKSSGRSDNEGAVVCTPNKTYNVRQVNTSNSVYVCQARQPDADDSGGYISSVFQGIAQTTFTLELDPSKDNTASSHLRAALPTYSSTGTFQYKESKSKQGHFDDIPLSQGECEQAWRQLSCFEATDRPGCFLPSATAKLQAWRSILQQADASGIELTGSLSRKQVLLIIDENDEWPAALSQAVLQSVSTSAPNGASIEEELCVKSIGETTLVAMSEGRSTSLASFLQEWRDSMPEKWRPKVDLERLPKGCYKLDNDGKGITSVGHGGGDVAAAPAATEAKSALGAKRKWHEKFRASKKT